MSIEGAHTPKLMFGVNIPTSASSDDDPITAAQQAESLSFDFVSANDHPCGSAPSFETWTMLCWIAARTTRVKVATRVLGVPYRSPAMVAKMAESFDRLSKGRLILGMGAGYSDEEFRAFGLGSFSPKEKIEGLEDAVRIVRGLWSEKRFTFHGRHHHTYAAEMEPKPSHRIPIWLGAFKPLSLAVTGRVADGWIPSLDMALPEDVPAMKEQIFAAARSAGRDPSAITLAYNVSFRVGEDLGPGRLSGKPTEMIDGLRMFMELGFSAFNFVPVGPGSSDQIERLATEVLAPLRRIGVAHTSTTSSGG